MNGNSIRVKNNDNNKYAVSNIFRLVLTGLLQTLRVPLRRNNYHEFKSCEFVRVCTRGLSLGTDSRFVTVLDRGLK